MSCVLPVSRRLKDGLGQMTKATKGGSWCVADVSLTLLSDQA